MLTHRPQPLALLPLTPGPSPARGSGEQTGGTEKPYV
ncbi:exported hypothetical protein [Cupriavidus taiwanensis]|uniref:Uncharacterized protein n=1 Tax=Cupriavidus taiwanensis TaxID=164546 RepID=A0A375BCQ5_9BURK|nr:exported hypothetical protein [Cupriavidus taiwanensis]